MQQADMAGVADDGSADFQEFEPYGLSAGAFEDGSLQS